METYIGMYDFNIFAVGSLKLKFITLLMTFKVYLNKLSKNSLHSLEWYFSFFHS